ncbi:hypothetical protein QVD99_002657 [Batrachochytrium dendrobatidis]|nr:hypothetical protein QVD99_002657 [Batrachochytrium dendrobatidis]
MEVSTRTSSESSLVISSSHSSFEPLTSTVSSSNLSTTTVTSSVGSPSPTIQPPMSSNPPHTSSSFAEPTSSASPAAPTSTLQSSSSPASQPSSIPQPQPSVPAPQPSVPPPQPPVPEPPVPAPQPSIVPITTTQDPSTVTTRATLRVTSARGSQTPFVDVVGSLSSQTDASPTSILGSSAPIGSDNTPSPLSTAAIAGTAAAVVGCAILTLIVGVFLIRRRRRQQTYIHEQTLSDIFKQTSASNGSSSPRAGVQTPVQSSIQAFNVRPNSDLQSGVIVMQPVATTQESSESMYAAYHNQQYQQPFQQGGAQQGRGYRGTTEQYSMNDNTIMAMGPAAYDGNHYIAAAAPLTGYGPGYASYYDGYESLYSTLPNNPMNDRTQPMSHTNYYSSSDESAINSYYVTAGGVAPVSSVANNAHDSVTDSIQFSHKDSVETISKLVPSSIANHDKLHNAVLDRNNSETNAVHSSKPLPAYPVPEKYNVDAEKVKH